MKISNVNNVNFGTLIIKKPDNYVLSDKQQAVLNKLTLKTSMEYTNLIDGLEILNTDMLVLANKNGDVDIKLNKYDIHYFSNNLIKISQSKNQPKLNEKPISVNFVLSKKPFNNEVVENKLDCFIGKCYQYLMENFDIL